MGRAAEKSQKVKPWDAYFIIFYKLIAFIIDYWCCLADLLHPAEKITLKMLQKANPLRRVQIVSRGRFHFLFHLFCLL